MGNINRERAAALLSQMTVREKVGQLAQNFFGFRAYTRNENGEIILTDAFKAYVQKFGGIGMLNNYFRADPWTGRGYATGGIVLREREQAYNVLQKYVVEHTRLGIPVLVEEDAPHGRQVLDSILYPTNCNVGCTFHPALYRAQAECIGEEARLGGVHIPYLSLFDMAMDPRWGRSEECFSEDPYLAARLSEAAVSGMNDAGSMVCGKHFAGQGAALGGHNGGVADIGERELREIHLPAVQAAVRAGCDFIMAAYNEIDGLPCHANAYLLRTVLRDEFGFDGVVRSDGCAIDRLEAMTDGDLKKSAVLALKAGVDCGLWDEAYEHLPEAVAAGLIDEKLLDEAVLRLLEKKFKCGVMDNPYLAEDYRSEQYVRSGKGQKIAYEMATESLVLLKNENRLLPLDCRKKVLLIGGNFDNVYCLLGDYTSPRRGMKSVRDIFAENGAAYLEGWNFEDGITVSDAALEAAVSAADAVIFGCGGSSVRDFESSYNGAGAVERAAAYMDCGEGCDLASLQLHPAQGELLKKITQFNKPVISLVIGGRAYILNEIAAESDAVIYCGYPGQEGARAIFDALYGRVNNFGRLAVSFPKHAGQLPVYYNQKATADYVDYDRNPLFEFGYGLCYSEFAFSDFKVCAKTLPEIDRGEALTVTFKVQNISAVRGKAVPQLYIRKKSGTVTHRVRQLCDFAKVELLPGETKTLRLKIGKEALAEWSVNRQYELLPLAVNVAVGISANRILFEKAVQIKEKAFMQSDGETGK